METPVKPTASHSLYHYRGLPRGNAHQWPEIVEFLAARGVRLEWSCFESGGAMFRWPIEDELKGLFPVDEDGEPFFGTDDSGFSIFTMSDEAAQAWCDEMKGTAWTPCQEL